MSVDALLAEVTANVGIVLAIKAADSLYFKANRVYTNIPVDVAHIKTGKGGRRNHNSSHHIQNAIRETIDDAKRAIDEVRGTKGGRSKNNSRSRNRDEVSQLKADIAKLQLENSEIKCQLAQIKQLVEKEGLWPFPKPHKCVEVDSPSCSRVLILGDGNLTFSAYYAQKYRDARIVGSVLERSEEVFLSRYPRGNGAMKTLKSMTPRCDVVFGIDATDLPCWAQNFDIFIMNFPHPGGKTNLRTSRELLRKIFRSLRMTMRPSAKFHLALTRLQAGIQLPLCDFQHGLWSDILPVHNKDSWQPLYIAAAEGFFCERICEFTCNDFYQPAGYMNRDTLFHNKDAVVLEFASRNIPNNLATAKMAEENNRKQAIFSKIRPFFVYDVSVLYVEGKSRVESDEAEVCKTMRKIGGVLLADVSELSGVGIDSAVPVSSSKPGNKGTDDEFDLFGSEDEEESVEKKRITEERLAAYAAKKSAKSAPIAKSSVIMDVKPWDDETDLKEMEGLVKGISQDGLLWGASKFIPIGYGIQKLQVLATVEDAKVSVDDLIEKIQEDFADHVQSVDIVAFNKI